MGVAMCKEAFVHVHACTWLWHYERFISHHSTHSVVWGSPAITCVGNHMDEMGVQFVK